VNDKPIYLVKHTIALVHERFISRIPPPNMICYLFHLLHQI